MNICKIASIIKKKKRMHISVAIILLETLQSIAGYTDFSCPKDWALNRENGQCYYISKQYANFDVAEKSCNFISSTLASILSFDELLFILPLTLLERDSCSSADDCLNYWIGLRNDFGKWTWTGGSQVSNIVSFWGNNMPSGAHHCGLLNSIDESNELHGYWRDESCKKPMRYICKKVVDCPDGFIRVSGVNHCYKVISNLMTWAESYNTCKMLHPRSALAFITNSAETDAVTKFLKTEFAKNDSACVSDIIHKQNVWIGGQRSDTSRCNVPFVWKPSYNIDLPMFYTNWFPGQPDCGGGYEHCMHISQSKGYTWNDELCVSVRCALCQASF